MLKMWWCFPNNFSASGSKFQEVFFLLCSTGEITTETRILLVKESACSGKKLTQVLQHADEE